jgi:hypothetical protein
MKKKIANILLGQPLKNIKHEKQVNIRRIHIRFNEYRL